jgi:LysR family transcriptional regulator, glycine cleavage system transcriptional activator
VKRSLLPLNALRVFDAAARHLSFTRAADELAVTPAAVGQQIRALEDVLGVILFRRTSRGLELTAEGEAGLTDLRQGFAMFEDAVRAMRAGQSSKALTIAAPRDFTAAWLAPRLARIGESDADLRFTLLAADDALSFNDANLDLAIIWADGLGDYEGQSVPGGQLVRVAAPGRGNAAPIAWPGIDDLPGETAMRCADAGTAIAVARAGMGVATVPFCLVQPQIDEGSVEQVGEAVPFSRSYWLVAPAPQWRQKKVQSLVSALLAA